MENYIEIRCPNKKTNNRFCNHILGAIKESGCDTIFYCPSCNKFWNILINKGLATIKQVHGKIKTRQLADVYTVEVESSNDFPS